jgi:hypothetical protein
MGVPSMKRFICSAAIATALLGASVISSSASTVIPYSGSFDVTGTADFSNNTGFTLTGPETVSITGSETNISPPFTVTLSEVSPTPDTVDSVTSSTWTITENLAAGVYNLLVAGTANTGLSGYSGQIVIGAVSPVPIPGALVLFASGLGLLGFWGLSKRRKVGSGLDSLNAVAC